VLKTPLKPWCIGSKETLKYALIVNSKTPKEELQEERLNDIFVRIVKPLLALKD